jgi:hypothetical protein
VALKGTLRDFGIADILQLISQQTKTGVLHLQSKDEEVHVSFHEGEVVRAEHRTRNKKDLLGGMLVAAGLLTDAVLQQALEEQKRTLRRLGDILIDTGAISTVQMREMAQLQATETLYRLFHWKSGTYEFEQGMVEWDRDSIAPIRAESVLMEGFRRVDEWPIIRRVIASSQLTFERVRSLDPEGESEEGPYPTGENERRVMQLVLPGRTAEQIADLSRLGEFETAKALLNLVQGGYLRAIAPRKEDGDRSSPTFRTQVSRFGTRLAMSAVILATILGILWSWRAAEAARAAGLAGFHVQDDAAQRLLAGPQLARIQAALQVFRLEHGGYPESLRDVVTAGLLEETDLRWPWVEPYQYRRAQDRTAGYVLLPPLR